MIRVIREDGMEILLNTSVIEKVESTRERRGIITLGSGERIKVKTPAFDVIQKIKAAHSGLKQERRQYDKDQDQLEKEKEKLREQLEKEKAEKEAIKETAPQEDEEEKEEKNWNVMDVMEEEKKVEGLMRDVEEEEDEDEDDHKDEEVEASDDEDDDDEDDDEEES
jgi:uncharacterized protein YlzI (FlbEa/FlbD family)